MQHNKGTVHWELRRSGGAVRAAALEAYGFTTLQERQGMFFHDRWVTVGVWRASACTLRSEPRPRERC